MDEYYPDTGQNNVKDLMLKNRFNENIILK